MWSHKLFLLGRTPIGGRVRRIASKSRFLVHRFIHSRSEEFERAQLASVATWELVKFALSSSFFAGVAVVLLVGLPNLYSILAVSYGLKAIPLPSVAEGVYSQLMSTIVQAAAAMLALFFTAISVVTSTSYANVTSEIRSLVANDDLNRRYLRLLAHTATTAAIGAGLQALGASTSVVLVVYVVLLAALCVLAFIPLGVRTFALFDATNLCGYPMRTFAISLHAVANRGFRWLVPSFQNHANRVATDRLRVLTDLVTFAIAAKRPRQESVVAISSAINKLLRHYSTYKQRIPSDSFWFARRQEFKRWEAMSGSTTELVLKAGITPSADLVPDHSFVESKAIEANRLALAHLLDQDALDDAADLLNEVAATVLTFSRNLQQAEAIAFVTSVRNTLLPYLMRRDPTARPRSDLQLVDLHCFGAVAPVLHTALELTERPIEEVFAAEKAILGRARSDLYEGKYPRECLSTLEDLFGRVEFEFQAEGRVQTQGWFVRQVIAATYSEALRTAAARIVDALEKEFLRPAEQLIDGGKGFFAAVWLHRALEACQKARTRIEELSARHVELSAHKVSGATWPTLDVGSLLGSTSKARARTISLLARVVPELSEARQDDGLPDLLGQVRAWLADELVLVMDKKGEAGFSELFVAFFNGTIAIRRYHAERARIGNEEYHVRLAIEAGLDLMEMSGIAFIYSELDRTNFKAKVTSAWDQYLGTPDIQARIKALYIPLEGRLMLPFLSPSAMQRQKWSRQLAESLGERGVVVRDEVYFGADESSSRPGHASPVVNSMRVSLANIRPEPHIYFATLYLSTLEAAREIPVPQSVESCRKTIARYTPRPGKSNG